MNDMVHYLMEEDNVVSAKLEYCKQIGRLTVELAYSPYIVSFNNVGRPINCTSERVINAITRTATTGTQVCTHHDDTLLGAQFMHNDELYNVVSIDAHFCFCAQVEGDGDNVEVRMQREVVKQLVDDYLE
jgi:hypothetical protein